jgi:cell division protein FtsN
LWRWLISAALVAWAFVLGVLVGQGSLANDQQISSLRALSLSWFGISVQNEEAPEAPLRNPQLSFYDQLGSGRANSGAAVARPRPELPAESPPATPMAAAPATPMAAAPATPAAAPATPAAAPPPAITPVTDAPPAAVNQPPPLNQVRPYQPDAPLAVPSEIPAPAPAPSIPSGRFTIQVGSFQDERQAQELANRLRRSGFASYISRTRIQGVGTRIRVRVGGFDSKE